jgi:hypothetical protein
MNETPVEYWSSIIDPNDAVLYGGDVAIRTSAVALLD